MRLSLSGHDGKLLVMNRGFYVPHRLCIGYARIGKIKEDPNRKTKGEPLPSFDPIPHFSSLEEWRPVLSTKIQSVADLCVHFLSRDDAPLPTVTSDGLLVFPPMPSTTNFSHQQKILIYQEYPSLGPLLRNVVFPCFLGYK